MFIVIYALVAILVGGIVVFLYLHISNGKKPQKLALSDKTNIVATIVNLVMLVVAVVSIHIALKSYQAAQESGTQQQRTLEASKIALSSVVETLKNQQKTLNDSRLTLQHSVDIIAAQKTLLEQSVKTSRNQLAVLDANVKILKSTQSAKVAIDYIKIDDIDFDTKIPTEIFVGIRNNGTVSAALEESTHVCAAIASKPPTLSECQRLSEIDKEHSYKRKPIKSLASNSLGSSVGDIGYIARVNYKVTDKTKTDLKEGKLHLYVKGVIAYSDYATRKKTELCSQWIYTEDMYPGGPVTYPPEYISRWTSSCEKSE